MRKVERFKNDIIIDDILVYQEAMTYEDVKENNWVEIEPKYYIDKSDDMIYEIWYYRTGIILDRGLNIHIRNDEIATDWNIESLKRIEKDFAMIKYRERLLREERLAELDAEEKQEISNYNNKNLMARTIKDTAAAELEPSFDEWIEQKNDLIDAMKYNIENNKLYIGVDFSNAEQIKQQNNGGSSDWYLIPDNAKTLQDLIEHRNMNGAVKDMFKACYRLGIKTEDELRDLNKTAYYALREIGRVTGRKDYITIAKELIGSQAIEKE